MQERAIVDRLKRFGTTRVSDDVGGEPRGRLTSVSWLVVIPLCSLLVIIALLMTLAAFVGSPAPASHAASITQERPGELEPPVVDETDGRAPLLRLGPAFTR